MSSDKSAGSTLYLTTLLIVIPDRKLTSSPPLEFDHVTKYKPTSKPGWMGHLSRASDPDAAGCTGYSTSRGTGNAARGTQTQRT